MPAKSDVSLIGSYLINVKAELTIFDDYTKTASTTIENSFDFTVYLTPCQITDYVDTLRVIEIRYVLGTPDL